MLFNSLDFAIFLPIVFILYWFVFNNNFKKQNFLIVVVSYVFYGWWDWRFLSLILFSTLVDYIIGIKLVKEYNKNRRKIFLWVSILINIGLLGFFKYFNFFIDNFRTAFSFFGMEINTISLNIILPVGISFYTFQTLSYTIDIYKRKLEPTRNFIAFAAFVSFFPQLVAGPIERATNLLPQFYKKRTFIYSKSVDGLRQILWGLFKKIIIADNCAIYVNDIFNNYQNYSGSTLVVGALFFSFQIYGDFSGYSDIAIGTARLFGFNLKQNFAFPYFSRDIAEFWRRWHISLSTWFRDYLYIPLGGSKSKNIGLVVLNVFIVFIVSGFWHGANWTFIFWGCLNALYFIPLIITNKNRVNLNTVAENTFFPSINEFLKILFTFVLVLIGWIFFRSDSINQGFEYLERIFSYSTFSIPEIRPRFLIILLSIFIFLEWIGRFNKFGIEKLFLNKPKAFRWLFYYCLVLIIVLYGGKQADFIYFQF